MYEESGDRDKPESAYGARDEGSANFRFHVLVFAVVNAGLVLLWLGTVLVTHGGTAWFPWFLFITAGWGIHLASRAWEMYGPEEIKPEERALAEIRRLHD